MKIENDSERSGSVYEEILLGGEAISWLPEGTTLDFGVGISELREYMESVMWEPFDKKRLDSGGKAMAIAGIHDLGLFAIEEFSKPGGVRVLDMPIKMAGSDEYRLPGELGQFARVARFISEIENVTNGRHRDYYAYLTVHQSDVLEGSRQRRGGAHIDGLQGDRIMPKISCEHSYLISDAVPTRFYTHGFNFSEFDETKYNVYQEMDRQAKIKESFLTENNLLYFFDCYAVHESTKALKDEHRTFLRVLYCLRQFDRLGNTHNSCFDYRWEMVPREIPEHLKRWQGE